MNPVTNKKADEGGGGIERKLFCKCTETLYLVTTHVLLIKIAILIRFSPLPHEYSPFYNQFTCTNVTTEGSRCWKYVLRFPYHLLFSCIRGPSSLCISFSPYLFPVVTLSVLSITFVRFLVLPRE